MFTTQTTETIQTKALSQATKRLQSGLTPVDYQEARLEAEVLLCHVLGLDRAALYARLNVPLPKEAQATYDSLLARRLTGEPVACITGEREFYGLTFHVDRRVLIPRPETELLVERALQAVADWQPAPCPSREGGGSPLLAGEGAGGEVRIADVGCGSGCIAVTLAVHLPNARIYATDISAEALEVTILNARRHGVGDRVIPLQGDLLSSLPEPVDLIVANLPYINHADLSALLPGITAYEPRLALDGGPDGLTLIRRLLAQAATYLRPVTGTILMEIGYDQAEEVTTLARQHFSTARVTLHHDLAGHARVAEIVPYC